MRKELETTLLHCRNLPSPPGVALQIIALAQDPNTTLAEVAEAISTDPALSARLLRIANSPLYAARRRVGTLSQAMGMLGLNATLSLALGFSLMHGLRGRNGTAELQEYIWKHSVLAALAARVLGQRAGVGRPEMLMLAGLLQDIGRLALLQALSEGYAAICAKAQDHDSLLAMECAAYDADHAEIGAWLAQRWGLPDYLTDAIANSESDVHADDDFQCCVQAASAIADLWMEPAGTAEALRERAQSKLTDCVGGDTDTLDDVLAEIAAALPEISAAYEVKIEHPSHLQGITDQAREVLILRNLRQIQEMAQSRNDTHAIEERMRQLTEQSRRDPLTGVFNRLHMEEALERDFRSAGQTHPLTIALIDLDDFKQVNDRYGHLVGDQVLRQFAQSVQRTLRSSDLIARYGGEEFLLVLNYSDEDASALVLQRLLEDVAQLPMAVVEGQPVHVTFSAGMATHNGVAGSFGSAHDLLKAADDLLYAAKRQGRNRVHLHQP